MKERYTGADIANALGVTRRAIYKRAEAEHWPYEKVSGRGRGGQKLFPLASLPREVQDAVAVWEARREAEELPAPELKCEGLTERERRSALARADMVRLYSQWLSRAGRGNKVEAREEFIRAYRGGAWPQLLEILGPKVSWKSIERWKVTIRRDRDVYLLADKRGSWRRGERSVTEEQAKILLRCALHPNAPLVSEAIRMARAVMRARGIRDGLSDATYRRWLDDFRRKHEHIWVFTREGKSAWNDKCAYYIERDYELLQVGDILVADGHPLNFEIIHPFNGQPKRMVLLLWYDMKSSYPCGWEIMPTENTDCIASAFRRAVLTLGKIPRVAYLDNGKAFGAKYFTESGDLAQCGVGGLFERLGVQVIHAWPYHGQSKTVERFFGTFAELERWTPSYCGTSIDKKPPRMKRGEKMHRALWDRTVGRALTIEEAHWAVATWFDEYAKRPQRGHLNGRTPLEVFLEGRGDGVDEDALRDLMLAQVVRTIGRNGVRFLGNNYYHPALYGRRHRVLVRYDWREMERVHVYEYETGEFICTAEQIRAIHPAAAQLGTDEDREALEKAIAFKKAQEREASSICREVLRREVLPEYQRRLEDLTGRSESAVVTPMRPARPAGPTDAEIERIRREVAELEAMQPAEPEEVVDVDADPGPELVREDVRDALRAEDLARYERLIRAEMSGGGLDAADRTWMRVFESSPEYRRHEAWFEDLRLRAAVESGTASDVDA